MARMKRKTFSHQTETSNRCLRNPETRSGISRRFLGPKRPGKKAQRALLSGLLLLCLAGLVLALAAPALADAGPFPTRTPTQTATLIATVAIPTPIVLTIIPSLDVQQNLPEATQPLPAGGEAPVVDPQIEAQQEDAPAPSAALACWPIAIILILAILVGGSYVLTQGRG